MFCPHRPRSPFPAAQRAESKVSSHATPILPLHLFLLVTSLSTLSLSFLCPPPPCHILVHLFLVTYLSTSSLSYLVQHLSHPCHNVTCLSVTSLSHSSPPLPSTSSLDPIGHLQILIVLLVDFLYQVLVSSLSFVFIIYTFNSLQPRAFLHPGRHIVLPACLNSSGL